MRIVLALIFALSFPVLSGLEANVKSTDDSARYATSEADEPTGIWRRPRSSCTTQGEGIGA